MPTFIMRINIIFYWENDTKNS